MAGRKLYFFIFITYFQFNHDVMSSVTFVLCIRSVFHHIQRAIERDKNIKNADRPGPHTPGTGDRPAVTYKEGPATCPPAAVAAAASVETRTVDVCSRDNG